VKVLLGEAPDELPPLIASEAGTETVYFTALEQSKYWKSVDPRACEPRNGNTTTHLVAYVILYRVIGLEDVSFSIPGEFVHYILSLVLTTQLRNPQGPSPALLVRPAWNASNSFGQQGIGRPFFGSNHLQACHLAESGTSVLIHALVLIFLIQKHWFSSPTSCKYDFWTMTSA
jgi:hypothetical protein